MLKAGILRVGKDKMWTHREYSGARTKGNELLGKNVVCRMVKKKVKGKK